MLQRVLIYAGLLVTLVVFALIMGAGEKDSHPVREGVAQSLNDLYQDVQAENWGSALASWEELEQAWTVVSRRLSFIEERLPLFQLETNLARLKGGILAQDRSSALQLILEMQAIWRGF